MRWLIAITLIVFSGCAGKKMSMENASIRTVSKLRVGVVELSSHDFNIPFLYECMKGLPANGMLLDGQTRQELQTENWYSDNLIASLQKNDFATYENIKNFSLVMLLFKNKEQKSFVRLINFLSKQVRTVPMSTEQFTCENVLQTARLLLVDSIPPYADVYLNDRKVGEAPIWTSLSDGTYEVQCKLPDDVFPKKTVQIPDTFQHFCKRSNQSMHSIEHDSDDNATASEKSQSLFIYAVLGLISAAGAVLPFLLF